MYSVAWAKNLSSATSKLFLQVNILVPLKREEGMKQLIESNFLLPDNHFIASVMKITAIPSLTENFRILGT